MSDADVMRAALEDIISLGESYPSPATGVAKEALKPTPEVLNLKSEDVGRALQLLELRKELRALLEERDKAWRIVNYLDRAEACVALLPLVLQRLAKVEIELQAMCVPH